MGVVAPGANSLTVLEKPLAASVPLRSNAEPKADSNALRVAANVIILQQTRYRVAVVINYVDCAQSNRAMGRFSPPARIAVGAVLTDKSCRSSSRSNRGRSGITVLRATLLACCSRHYSISRSGSPRHAIGILWGLTEIDHGFVRAAPRGWATAFTARTSCRSGGVAYYCGDLPW